MDFYDESNQLHHYFLKTLLTNCIASTLGLHNTYFYSVKDGTRLLYVKNIKRNRRKLVKVFLTVFRSDDRKIITLSQLKLNTLLYFTEIY